MIPDFDSRQVNMLAVRDSSVKYSSCSRLLISVLMIGLVFGEFKSQTFGLIIVSVCCLCIFLLQSSQFLRVRISFVLCFALLAVLGSASALRSLLDGSSPSSADIQRDLLIVLGHLLALLLGYSIAVASRTYCAFWALAITACVLSLAHLVLLVVAFHSGVSSLAELRIRAGRGTLAEEVGLICLLLLGVGGDSERRTTIVRRVMIAIISVSVVLSFSRGLMINLFIIVVLIVCLRRPSSFPIRALRISFRKVFLFGAVFGASVIVGIALVSEFLPAVYEFVDKYYFAKIETSWREVSTYNDTSRVDISSNYRGYESGRAMAEFENAGWVEQLFGQGYGAVVDLGVETASTTSTFSRRSAPFLHNGYLYFLVKTGVLGLLLYFGFLFYLLYRAVVGASNSVVSYYGRSALVSCVLILGVGTFTTGGFGYPSGYLSLAFLIGILVVPEEAMSGKDGSLRTTLSSVSVKDGSYL